MNHTMVSLLCLFSVLVSSPARSADRNLRIGPYVLIVDERKNAPLEIAAATTAGLRDLNFVGRVGGVNFEEVAQAPADATPRLSIDSESRVTMHVGEALLDINLPAWQLVPISLIANSDYTALVSAFGDGPNKNRYFYLQYHPALEDTLLGLRLLHADLFLRDPAGYLPLPTTANGDVLLGEGETVRENKMAGIEAAGRLAADLSMIFASSNVSWVLTDISHPPLLQVVEDGLRVSAFPYFYFWRHAGFAEVRALNNATKAVGHNRELFKAYNPVVYAAVERTATYTGLFRWVRRKNQKNWDDFLRRVSSLDMRPKVSTPTRLDRYQ